MSLKGKMISPLKVGDSECQPNINVNLKSCRNFVKSMLTNQKQCKR